MYWFFLFLITYTEFDGFRYKIINKTTFYILLFKSEFDYRFYINYIQFIVYLFREYDHISIKITH